MDGARFQVERILTIGGRPHFFLLGELLDGTVKLGMRVTAGPAHRPSFREAVDAIEFLEDRRAGTSWVALGFRHLDTAERGRWGEMTWDGVVLEIPATPILHPCPCCGFRTLVDEERGSYDICDRCAWEDDFVQYRDPDYPGGANSESLNEARAAFAAEHPDLIPAPHG